MDQKTALALEEKAKLLTTIVTQKESEAVRNDMFGMLVPFLHRWIKGLLGYKKIHMDGTEITSLCWDCFLFCLERYHPDRNIPIPNHFYAYTRFFLLKWLSNQQEQKEAENTDVNSTIDDSKHDNLNFFYEQLDELKKFREHLPENYKPIFDDAVLSIAGKPRDRIPYKKSDGYSYYKYCEAKKSFKIIIDFLLRR